MSEFLSNQYDFEEIVSGVTPSWAEEDAILVPPQCEFCPIATAALHKFNEYKKAVGELLRMASAEEEEIVVVNMLTGERLSEGATDRVCEITGEKLNELDKIKEEIVRSTDKCKGPLDLEGSDDFQAVSITACGSSEMSEPDVSYPQIGESVEIRRLRIQRYQEGNKD